MVSVRAERLLSRIGNRWIKMGDMKLGDGRGWIEAANELISAGLIERHKPEGARDFLYRRAGDGERDASTGGSWVPPERDPGETKADYLKRLEASLAAFRKEPDPIDQLGKLSRNLIHAYSSADGEEAGIGAMVELLARFMNEAGHH